MVDYFRIKFGDCSFSRFGFIMICEIDHRRALYVPQFEDRLLPWNDLAAAQDPGGTVKKATLSGGSRAKW